MNHPLTGKTIFISGASRGIGKAIALEAASHGAQLVIAAKTDVPHPTLPGTIHDVVEEIQARGGKALPLKLDVRNPEEIQTAVDRTMQTFGSIDALINNASAISLTNTLETPVKRFDLMFQVNVRATFLLSQAVIPHLLKAENPHIINLAPPINLHPKWFKNHCAYTISKYGMSMCVLGMAEELREDGIKVNGLWPATLINTAALRTMGNDKIIQVSRNPEIMAQAAISILQQTSPQYTGQFLIDEEVLKRSGIDDFSGFQVNPKLTPQKDLFLD